MDKIELVSQPANGEHRDANQVLQLTLRKLRELVKENPAECKYGGDETHECLEQYDQDGFEIPQGKIPLDGHFSTEEIQELVKFAQDNGIISKSIGVKILSENETVGDTIEISDLQEGINDEKEGDDNDEKEDDKKDEKEDDKKDDKKDEKEVDKKDDK